MIPSPPSPKALAISRALPVNVSLSIFARESRPSSTREISVLSVWPISSVLAAVRDSNASICASKRRSRFLRAHAELVVELAAMHGQSVLDRAQPVGQSRGKPFSMIHEVACDAPALLDDGLFEHQQASSEGFIDPVAMGRDRIDGFIRGFHEPIVEIIGLIANRSDRLLRGRLRNSRAEHRCDPQTRSPRRLPPPRAARSFHRNGSSGRQGFRRAWWQGVHAAPRRGR